jgi:DNA primase
MSTPAEQVKEKLDIVEFMKAYLTLQPAGRNFKAPCPFHKEKTPSFMISPERQSWHCFGCAEHGDVFTFLMKYENIDFGEALRILADKAGVELKRINPAEHKFTGLLQDINEAAKKFFVQQLSASSEAKEYLASRKLQQKTMDEFEVGWAPIPYEALTLHLIKEGFRPEELVSAGVSLKTERGSQIDRFRGRIMFPIHNHFGKVVGFTGRVLPEFDNGQTGKYVNSPETPIFNKSKLLYGFWKTKNAIREKNAAFLVEGQMDFLMSWQAGVDFAVATSGTALTFDHLRTIRRVTDRLIMSFDSDPAGKDAGERAIDLAESGDFQVRVMKLEPYKDPGEIGEKDPSLLIERVKQAQPAPEFYFEKYLPADRFDPKDRDHLKQLRAVLGKLARIPSPVEQEAWMKELAHRVGVSFDLLRSEKEKIVPTQSPAPYAPHGDHEVAAAKGEIERTVGRRELLTRRLLSVLVAKGDLTLLGEHEAYLPALYAPLCEILKKGERKSEDPEKDQLLELIVLQAGEVKEGEIEELKRQLYLEYAKERRQELTLAVRQAEAKGDEAALAEALSELNRLPVL